VCGNHHKAPGRIHDALTSIRTSFSPRLILFFPSDNQQSSSRQQSQTLLNFKPSSFNPISIYKRPSPQLNPIPKTHNSNTMASPMYRPAFSRRTSTSNASVSSKSSSTSSTRAVYTRDSQGFFDLSYPSSGLSTEAEPLVARPTFTRAEYSRDARGQNIDFSASYKFSKQQPASSRAPFAECAYAKSGKGHDFSGSYKGRQ
jgi:hypothetical protein